VLSPRASVIVAILVGIVVGVSYPYVDLALACREAASEACVWGKAYLPLTLGLSLLVVGGVTAGLVYAVFAYRRKNSRRDHAD
jgi:hypothetical protein